MQRSAIRRSAVPMRRKKPSLAPDFKVAGVPWPAGWQTEAAFQRQVEDLAEVHGWITSHAHLPYFDTAGIPDLFMVKVRGKKRILMAELKATTKEGRVPKPSPAQQRWINAIIEAGGDCRVWTWPHDWDALAAELAA